MVSEARGQQKDCIAVDLTYTRTPNGSELAEACLDEGFKHEVEKIGKFFLEISQNQTCRIDRQKFCIIEIPIHEVIYETESTENKMFVIGEVHECYFP
eukprot:UN27925